MRISLFKKLFFSILSASCIMLITMTFFFNWSFRAGFVDFIHDSELARVEQLAATVGKYHVRSGGWDFLQQPFSAWSMILMQMGEKPITGVTQATKPYLLETHSAGKEQKGLHLTQLPLSRRIALLDLQQEQLASTVQVNILANMPFQQVAITAEGEQVGWLRVYQEQQINQATSGQLAHRFFERQRSTFIVVAGFAATLSFLIALLLMRHFLKPVRALSRGATQLCDGDYQHKIQVFSQDELGSLAVDFNTLANSLEHQKRMRQQWLADISHELRTPITALRCEIEAIQDGINPPTKEYIDNLHSTTSSLANLVNDLHQLSLTDSGGLPKLSQAVDLAAVLKEAYAAIQLRFKLKSISVRVELADTAPLTILSDLDLLRRLFINLFENSYRYTNPGGEVEVKVSLRQQRVYVVIQDSAPGVPISDLPHLFERLYRVDKSRSRVYGGSGLGLSICQNIVAAHAGTIDAQPSALGGLQINLSFPYLKNTEESNVVLRTDES